MIKQTIHIAFATLFLAACSSTPTRTVEPAKPTAPASEQAVVKPQQSTVGGGYLPGDGPGEDTPTNIEAIPDATPRNEPLHKYANRPYVALGKTYLPLTSTPSTYKVRGIASWYGKKFHGKRTSSGETYDMYGMTAAHPTLPIPSYVRVTNLANRKSVVVRVNDRGPFMHDRVIDLSYSAAYKLAIISKGSAEVEVEIITASSTSNFTVGNNEVLSRPLEEPGLVITTSLASDSTASPTAGSNIFLQLGAFRSQEGAESFMEKMRGELIGSNKHLSFSQKDGLIRVHFGPYASQSEARSSAIGLQDKLGFKPLLNLH